MCSVWYCTGWTLLETLVVEEEVVWEACFAACWGVVAGETRGCTGDTGVIWGVEIETDRALCDACILGGDKVVTSVTTSAVFDRARARFTDWFTLFTDKINPRPTRQTYWDASVQIQISLGTGCAIDRRSRARLATRVARNTCSWVLYHWVGAVRKARVVVENKVIGCDAGDASRGGILAGWAVVDAWIACVVEGVRDGGLVGWAGCVTSVSVEISTWDTGSTGGRVYAVGARGGAV